MQETPFSENNNFREEFTDPRIQFLTIDSFNRASRLVKKLYSVSELMRRDGYYRRHRFTELGYYWSNITRRYSVDGAILLIR